MLTQMEVLNIFMMCFLVLVGYVLGLSDPLRLAIHKWGKAKQKARIALVKSLVREALREELEKWECHCK